jgi:hypothetical protein
MPRFIILSPVFFALASACEASEPAQEPPLHQAGQTSDTDTDGSVGEAGGPAGGGTPQDPPQSTDAGGAPGAAGGKAGAAGAEAGAAGAEAGAGGRGPDASEVALVPEDGWLDGLGNSLGVQGAAYVVADQATAKTLESDLAGSHLCMRGTASQVDLGCTPASPGTDCFALYWGAAIALNLNQASPEDVPLPYDASAFSGFSFDVVGPLVPSRVRFSVETQDASFCLPLPLAGMAPGTWDVGVDELVTRCHQPPPNAENASSAKPRFTALRWTVVGDYTQDVPFDFCVENLRVKVD